MYKAKRVITVGGMQFAQGERITGVKENELKELLARDIIEVEDVQVEVKDERPKRKTKQVTPKRKTKAAK